MLYAVRHVQQDAEHVKHLSRNDNAMTRRICSESRVETGPTEKIRRRLGIKRFELFYVRGGSVGMARSVQRMLE